MILTDGESNWQRIFGERNPETLQEIELQMLEQEWRIYGEELVAEMSRVAGGHLACQECRYFSDWVK